jgi:hypothetical protein
MQHNLEFEADFVIQFQNLLDQIHRRLDQHLMLDHFLQDHLF